MNSVAFFISDAPLIHHWHMLCVAGNKRPKGVLLWPFFLFRPSVLCISLVKYSHLSPHLLVIYLLTLFNILFHL